MLQLASQSLPRGFVGVFELDDGRGLLVKLEHLGSTGLKNTL